MFKEVTYFVDYDGVEVISKRMIINLSNITCMMEKSLYFDSIGHYDFHHTNKMSKHIRVVRIWFNGAQNDFINVLDSYEDLVNFLQLNHKLKPNTFSN